MISPLAQLGVPSFQGLGRAIVVSWILCIIWGVLMVVALALLALGLAHLRRRAGRICAGLGAILFAGLVWVLFSANPKPHHSFVLDLSTSRVSQIGDWHPDGTANEFWSLQGNVDVSLNLPGGRTFTGPASFVCLNRKNRRIYEVVITTNDMPLDGATRLTAKYLQDWGFDFNHFDEWCDDRLNGKPDVKFYSYQNSTTPAFSLELRPGNSLHGHSWYLALSAFWSDPQ